MKKILIGCCILPLSFPFVLCGIIFQIASEAFDIGRHLYAEFCRKL